MLMSWSDSLWKGSLFMHLWVVMLTAKTDGKKSLFMRFQPRKSRCSYNYCWKISWNQTTRTLQPLEIYSQIKQILLSKTVKGQIIQHWVPQNPINFISVNLLFWLLFLLLNPVKRFVTKRLTVSSGTPIKVSAELSVRRCSLLLPACLWQQIQILNILLNQQSLSPSNKIVLIWI